MSGRYVKVLTDRERFMQYVVLDVATGCWLWRGHLDKDGYGKFTTGTSGNQKHHRAHRWISNAPAGQVAMHRCDTPACVNPEHITFGSQRDNRADCVAKGRQARGATHARWKHGRHAYREVRDVV